MGGGGREGVVGNFKVLLEIYEALPPTGKSEFPLLLVILGWEDEAGTFQLAATDLFQISACSTFYQLITAGL